MVIFEINRLRFSLETFVDFCSEVWGFIIKGSSVPHVWGYFDGQDRPEVLTLKSFFFFTRRCGHKSHEGDNKNLFATSISQNMFHVMGFSKYEYIVTAICFTLVVIPEWSWVQTKAPLQTNVGIPGWRDCVQPGIKIRHVKQERVMIWRCDRSAVSDQGSLQRCGKTDLEVYNPEMYKTH